MLAFADNLPTLLGRNSQIPFIAVKCTILVTKN